MPITLTTSQQAAIADSRAEPRTVVEFQSQHGTYYFASERLMWSGKQYLPRLLNEPGIVTGLGGTQGMGLAPTKTITLQLANADGWLSTQPPAFYRYGTVLVKEILMDVESYALRTFRFTSTGGGMPSATTFNIQCEDFWSVTKRRIFPSNSVLMTRQRFSGITELTNDDHPHENTPMNIVMGRCMAKLTLINNLPTGVDSGGLEWLVGYGSLALAPGGHLYQFPGPIERDFVLFEAGSYEMRQNVTLDGVPYTTVFVYPTGSPGDDAVDHYLDTRGGEYGWPDEFLLMMLTNSIVGVGIDATLIDSDSLLSARSFYKANNITFDFALNVQKPVESWLGDWCRDSLTRLILRDKLYLSPQTSREPVTSFHVGNIQKDTLSIADVAIGQEESRASMTFRDRFKDEDWRGKITYNVGSGSELPLESVLIGRPTVAGKVAQTVAKRGADGIRTYQFGSTLRMANLEEGDLVTLHHPLATTSGRAPVWGEVEAIRRGRGLLNFSIREVGSRLFKFGNIPNDTAISVVDKSCLPKTQHVLSPSSWGIISSGANDVLVLSHTLGKPVTTLTHKWSYAGWDTLYPFTLDTLSFSYNTGSTVPARMALSGTFPGPLLRTSYDLGFDLTLNEPCPADDPPPDPPASMAPPLAAPFLGVQAPSGADLHFWSSVASTAALTGWQMAGHGRGTIVENQIPTQLQLYAAPFITPRSGSRIGAVGLVVTTSQQGLARIGVYEARSTSDIYPGTLVLDVGTVELNTAGLTFTATSVGIVPDKLYYFVVVWSGFSSGRMRTYTNADQPWGLGATSGGTAILGWSVAGSMTLPATYPNNAVTFGGVFERLPAILFRFEV